VDYGVNYELSLWPDDIRGGKDYNTREFWMNRFGDDPIWG